MVPNFKSFCEINAWLSDNKCIRGMCGNNLLRSVYTSGRDALVKADGCSQNIAQ